MALSELFLTRLRYIDLLKRSILGRVYADNELRIRYLRRCLAGEEKYDPIVLRDIVEHSEKDTEKLVLSIEAGTPIDGDLHGLGFMHSMVGRKRLDNVEACVQTILRENIPGDFIECGVWRGGMAAFMRGLLEAYRVEDRLVWVADSFHGLPPPTAGPDVAQGQDISETNEPFLAASLDTVKRTFDAYGLLDAQVRFLPGWFKDTLPNAPIERLAILRLDGDMYESTRDALHALYDKVSPGGFVIVDDLCLPPCAQAIEEFRTERGITDPIVTIDWAAGYWRKSGNA